MATPTQALVCGCCGEYGCGARCGCDGFDAIPATGVVSTVVVGPTTFVAKIPAGVAAAMDRAPITHIAILEHDGCSYAFRDCGRLEFYERVSIEEHRAFVRRRIARLRAQEPR